MKSAHVMSIVAFFLLVAADPARADCTCVCMNGTNQPLCTNTLEVAPYCPPIICPFDSPNATSGTAHRTEKFGATNCYPQLVFDSWTNQYAWQQVCY
ncbi:MAG: hypothetical protein WD673_15280 [Alphaproteobacteria bacterium]